MADITFSEQYQISRPIAITNIIRTRWRWSGVLSPSIKAPGSAQRSLFRHAVTLCRIQYTVIIVRDVPSCLDQRYQPMWRRRMTQRATAATGLTITAQHRGETRKPRSNRSMSLKGEKSSMVVLWVEGSCYNMERRLSANRREGDDARRSRG